MAARPRAVALRYPRPRARRRDRRARDRRGAPGRLPERLRGRDRAAQPVRRLGGTFGAARAVTHAIRRGSGPFGNVHIGRRHIHHFVPGIALALGAGGASIAFRHQAVDRWLALPFGAGAALIIDETALLIELEDVYWSDRGGVSIDVAFGATSLLAVLALVARLLRRGEALVLPGPAG